MARYELSAVIRFRRAKGRCEACQRPHGRTVFHLGDGRWWDEVTSASRDGVVRIVCIELGANDVHEAIGRTRVVLTTAYRNHDTADGTDANLEAFCQRWHMNDNTPMHQRGRLLTLLDRQSLGDLLPDLFGRS